MTQKIFSEEELMRSHDYVSPQEEAGRRLHGGFLENGDYMPPRNKVRGPAIETWTEALRERGGDLLSADSSLLAGIRYPNAAQMKVLLQEGLGQDVLEHVDDHGTHRSPRTPLGRDGIPGDSAGGLG